MADPGYTGRHSGTVADIVGYEEYKNDTEGKLEHMEGIKVIDNYTISFTFKEALRSNIENLDYHIMPISYYGYEKGYSDEVLTPKLSDGIGSGPYRLVKFEPSQFVELELYNDYHGKKPSIKKIIYKMVQDATKVQEIITGNVDVIPGVIESQDLEMAKEAGFIDLHQYPRSGYGYLKFNTQAPIVKDKRIRQALLYGFDRQAFVDLYFNGLAKVQNVPMSQVSWAYTKELAQKLNPYEYNPEKAKELLEEAGWNVGADGIREKDGQKLVIEWASIKDLKLVDMLIPIIK